MKFIMLINVKMFNILTCISRINALSVLKREQLYIFQYFNIYEQLKFHAQMS